VKKVFFIISLAVTLCLIFLFIKGRNMQVISTEIIISSTPDKLWNIIQDVNNWKEWNPTVNKSSGTATLGAKLDITMRGKQEGSDGPRYTPIIKTFDKPRIFHWRAHMIHGFLFTNDKIIELEETPSGTRLTHKEAFKGLLAPIFCGQMEKGIPPMLNSMNIALKELAEK